MTPETMNMEQILAAMRMGRDFSFTIRIGAYEAQARPLSVSEYLRVTTEVASEMSTRPPAERTTTLESAMLAKKILMLATSPVPGGSVVGKLTEHILDRISLDELLFFYQQYLDACEVVNPALEQMPKDKLAELVAHVKKNTSEASSILTELSRKDLEAFALCLLTPDG